LPLELNGRDAGRLAGNQISRPEPDRELRMRAFHDGSGCETGVAATLPATKHPWASSDAIRLARSPAMRAGESTAPPGALKVCRACRLVWKQSLKLWQRARKWQIASQKHIDSHDSLALMQMLNILHIVAVCDNRISTI
jgi:hypothetical protein